MGILRPPSPNDRTRDLAGVPESFLLAESLTPAETERIGTALLSATPSARVVPRWAVPAALAASVLLGAFLLSPRPGDRLPPAGESRMVLHIAVTDRPDRPALRLEITYRKETEDRGREVSR